MGKFGAKDRICWPTRFLAQRREPALNGEGAELCREGAKTGES